MISTWPRGPACSDPPACREVQEKLSVTLQQILAKPEVRDRILASGAEPTPSDVPTFTALVKRQLEVWGRKVSDAGIQPE